MVINHPQEIMEYAEENFIRTTRRPKDAYLMGVRFRRDLQRAMEEQR